MKAAVIEQVGGPMVVEDIPEPKPRQGEVLVKVAACGVCHADLHVIKGEVKFPLPCVLGHEIAGTVAEVGPGVSGLKRGQRVVGAFSMAGLAEYAVTPATGVFPLPDGLGLEEACILGCAIPTAYGAVRHQAELAPGQSVAVIGIGGVGSNIIQIARAFGASQIIAVDITDEKLATAAAWSWWASRRGWRRCRSRSRAWSGAASRSRARTARACARTCRS